MTLPNSPIVNAGIMYVQGLQLSALVVPSVPVSGYVAGLGLVLSPGQARDSTNTNDIIVVQAQSYSTVPPSGVASPYVLNGLPIGAVINGGQLGANGVDAGVLVGSSYLAANSQYAVYVIGSSKSVFTSSDQVGAGFLQPPGILNPLPGPVNPFPGAGLLSLSSNGVPALPYEYDMYRQIGYASVNAAGVISAVFPFSSSAAPVNYSPVRALEATPGTANVYANLRLRNPNPPNEPYVPLAPGYALLSVVFTAAAPGDVASFLPFGAVPSDPRVVVVGAPAVPGAAQIVSVPYGMNVAVPTVQYKTSVVGDTLVVSMAGFVPA